MKILHPKSLSLLFCFGLIALLPATVWGGESYVISGKNLAGKASIQELATKRGKKMVKVKVSFRTFGKKGKKYSYSGHGFLSQNKKTLTWSYRKKVKKKEGFATRIRNLFRRGNNSEYIYKRFQVVMKSYYPGQYVGVVDGERQVWSQNTNWDDYTVLAVPGLSTNQWNRVGVPYMDENIKTMESMGLGARRLKIKTEASVATNAAFIRQEVLKEAKKGKKVIIFAHSKGATDTTAALAMYPRLHKKVAGVIAIQPVYAGSPVADLAAKPRALRGVIKVFFEKVFKGEKEAVFDLSHKSRKKFIARHPYPSKKVPTVVLRSTFDRKFSKSILWANQKVIEKVTGKASDGMVTLKDQNIPGAISVITVKNLDHFEPGLRGESPYTPAYITRRTIRTLMARLEPRPKKQRR